MTAIAPTLATAPHRPGHYPLEIAVNPAIVPVAAGAATALVSWRLGWAPVLPDPAAVLGFAGTVASVASTMLGFMLAALAVIASISNTALVERMRKTGHYDDLLATIFFGCGLFLAVVLCGFALLFGAPAGPVFLAVVLGLHAGALVSLIDIGRKFRLVLTNLR